MRYCTQHTIHNTSASSVRYCTQYIVQYISQFCEILHTVHNTSASSVRYCTQYISQFCEILHTVHNTSASSVRYCTQYKVQYISQFSEMLIRPNSKNTQLASNAITDIETHGSHLDMSFSFTATMEAGQRSERNTQCRLSRSKVREKHTVQAEQVKGQRETHSAG